MTPTTAALCDCWPTAAHLAAPEASARAENHDCRCPVRVAHELGRVSQVATADLLRDLQATREADQRARESDLLRRWTR